MTATALKISKNGFDMMTPSDAFSNVINFNTIVLSGSYSSGIDLSDSLNNTIYSNNITANSNGSVGIKFESSSDSNIIYNNIITIKGADNSSYVVSLWGCSFDGVYPSNNIR